MGITARTTELRRVLVLYNTDWDAELKSASPADVSAVEEAAIAVQRAVVDYGYACDLAGVHGDDLGDLIASLRRNRPDLVFNLVESLVGDTRNEVVVPSVLDLMQIPYTGPGPFTIGLCLRKDRAKEALAAHAIATPEYRVLAAEADLLSLPELSYPMFVKLVREDASIGIEASNLARDPAALRERARQLWEQYRQPVIAERFIEGREVNVTVMGNGADLRCLPLFEIDFASMPAGRPHIVSYAAKWDENHVDYAGTKPVPLRAGSPELCAAIERGAMATFRAMGMRDFGRVDMRIDRDGRPWVIDVNPNCDLSPGAGVAKAAEAAGMSYPQLCGRICDTAWKRTVDASPGDPVA